MEIPGERFDDALERAALDPGLKAAMTRLIRRIPRWKVFPGRSRPEDPENAVQHIPRIAPRPPAPIAADSRCR